MSNIVITSGSRYVDIDAYSSCIAYRELLSVIGIPAKAVTTAPFNESISEIVRKIPLSFDAYTPTEKDKFIILDVSEPEFLDKFVKESQIVELLDHHTGYEEYWKERLGKKSQIISIGSVATMIYEKFLSMNKKSALTQDVCKLLIAAITDNTLNLKAGITTEKDISAFKDLMEVGNIYKDWPVDYLEDCEKSILTDLTSSIRRDTKTNLPCNMPQTLGQLTVFNHEKIFASKHLIDKSFQDKDDWALNILSLKDGTSHLFTTSTISKKKLEKLFDRKYDSDVLKLDRLLLRKEIVRLAQEQDSEII